MYFQNLDFVPQLGPPAMHLGIFVSGAQGFLDKTQIQDALAFRVATLLSPPPATA